MDEIRKYKEKLLISDLIFDVLTEKKTVQEALSYFPHDDSDIDIKCAFDALMHREADEDLRRRLSDYAQMQDEFLETIANIFKQNEKLPSNIIAQYLEYHADNLISSHVNKKDFRSVIEYIKKIIKRMINF